MEFGVLTRLSCPDPTEAFETVKSEAQWVETNGYDAIERTNIILVLLPLTKPHSRPNALGSAPRTRAAASP